MTLIDFSMKPSPATKELIPKRMDNIAATIYMISLFESCNRFDFLTGANREKALRHQGSPMLEK